MQRPALNQNKNAPAEIGRGAFTKISKEKLASASATSNHCTLDEVVIFLIEHSSKNIV